MQSGWKFILQIEWSTDCHTWDFSLWSFLFLWVVFYDCFMSSFSSPCFSSQNLNWSWVMLGVLTFPAVCLTTDLLFCHGEKCSWWLRYPTAWPSNSSPMYMTHYFLVWRPPPQSPIVYQKESHPSFIGKFQSFPVSGLIQNPLLPGTLLW